MPRITENLKIVNDTNIGTPNATYYLLCKYLHLDSEYAFVYTMAYLDKVDGLFPSGMIFNVNNISKNIMTYNELIDMIKIYFSQERMLKYFGSNPDLNTDVLRKVYNNMAKYFLILFYKKINSITDISNLLETDSLLCTIAECMNIIRASVKKYARLRISKNAPHIFSKITLNRRNAQKYGCKNILNEYEYCPSFLQLQNGYTDGNGKWHNPKSCKSIIKSTLKTNDMYSFFSKFKPLFSPKKSYSRSFNFGNQIVRTKLKTRKIGHDSIQQITKKIKINSKTSNVNIE